MRKSLGIAMFFILLALPIAYSANGTNYTVEMFSSGMQSAEANSSEYDSKFILTVNTGTLNASGADYSSNIGFFNSTFSLNAPTIISYEAYPASASTGSIIRFYISSSGAQSLWALITRPDSVTDFVLLNNDNYTYYVSTNAVGVYSVTFYANNSAGITDVTTLFQITSIVTQPSSGGTASCEYVWNCTEWSTCEAGKQQRICTNVGTCTGDNGRPDETRTCEAALFDIKINPESIKIDESGLKFSINLSEMKGNEKIDVTITYNVTDINGTVVYSETETIAVYGNISFDKILKDINLVPGDYRLNAEITYGNNQKAIAAYVFKITEKGVEEVRPVEVIDNSLQIFLTIVLVLILSLLLLLLLLLFVLRSYFYYKRRKELVDNNVKIVKERDVFHDITQEKLSLVERMFKTLGAMSMRKSYKRKPGVSSIVDVMSREVFLNSGEHIGSVSDVIISDIKIESVIVKLNEKYSKSGISKAIIKQNNVKYYGDIVLVNKGIESVLKSAIPKKKRNRKISPKKASEETNFRNGVYSYMPVNKIKNNKRTDNK